jgi:hypothetical protein
VKRPLDWAPLADADPVPGDPARIELIGRRHSDFAAELEAQASTLRRLSDADGWDADAGRRFSSTAREIGDALGKARRRYTAVAEALRGYAPELAQVQREADAALRDAQAAQSAITANQPAPQSSSPTGDATPDPSRTRALADAQTALSQARRRLDHAVDRRDTGARRAAQHIQDVTDNDGLADSWWDKAKDWTSDRWDSFTQWVHENADLISKVADVCGWIATALAAVAIAISFIPVLNFLAAPLLLAATALTVVSLVAHVMLALSGDGSWVDVGFDLIGLATFGYGKVAAKGAEASEQVLKAAATRAARKEGQKAARRALEQGARRTSGRPISRAARQARTSQVRRAGQRYAQQALQEAATVKPSVLGKVRNMDGAAALQEARVRAMSQLAPRSAAAQQASRAAVSGLRKAAVSSGIGIGSDMLDKTGATDPIEKPLTFGRYASR